VFRWTKADYKVLMSVCYGCSPSDYLGKGTKNKPVVDGGGEGGEQKGVGGEQKAVCDQQTADQPASWFWDSKVKDLYDYLTLHPP
ncbi:hypothetical protein TrRE_jg1262, partial [Triparma retinervis]